MLELSSMECQQDTYTQRRKKENLPNYQHLNLYMHDKTAHKLAYHTQKQLDLTSQSTIIDVNNTPPASRQTSAPRGVTRFWGLEI